MAWEWSHTAEAYRDAELNLRDLPRDTLREIWAEITSRCVGHSDDEHDESAWCNDCYERQLDESDTLSDEQIADAIWDFASEQATCDNGGWNAWLCPYGCGCHVVPFDRDHVTA